MSINLDKVGAVASAICAVHCVITGLALGLLSVMGLGFFGTPAAELAFLFTAIGIGVVAVVHGIRKHHSYLPSIFFVGGLTCWLLAHFVFGHNHQNAAGPAHTPFGSFLSVLGGVGIVTFHILNQRMQHKCGCSHCTTGH